ncbi:MAG: hypothetical protein AAB783_01395 [Patescibacteria group bacterium]
MEYIQNVGSVPPQQVGGRSAKNIAVVVLLLIGVLAAGGYAYWKIALDTQKSTNDQQDILIQPQTSPPSDASLAPPAGADDTSAVIDAELNAAGDIGAIDEQFKDIDKAREGL